MNFLYGMTIAIDRQRCALPAQQYVDVGDTGEMKIQVSPIEAQAICMKFNQSDCRMREKT